MTAVLIRKATRPVSLVAKGVTKKEAMDRADILYESYKLLYARGLATSGTSICIVEDDDVEDMCEGWQTGDSRVRFQFGSF
jgi:hypothetical protein